MIILWFSQESAEHHNRLLSDRTQEIQELRKQLSNRQQQLTTAERHNSTTAQEGYLETAELRALLAEKDSIINVSSSGMQHLNCNLNNKIVKKYSWFQRILQSLFEFSYLWQMCMWLFCNFVETSASWAGQRAALSRYAEEGPWSCFGT